MDQRCLAGTWISMKEAHVLKLSINRAWQRMNCDLTVNLKWMQLIRLTALLAHQHW